MGGQKKGGFPNPSPVRRSFPLFRAGGYLFILYLHEPNSIGDYT